MKKGIGIVSAIFLLYGMGYGHAYSYYEFLRWATFLSSLFFSWRFYKSKTFVGIAIFLTIAYLFNPIFPVYLQKSTWVTIDFIAAIILIIGGFYKAKNDVVI